MKATKLLKTAIKLRKKGHKKFSHILVLLLRYFYSFDVYVSDKTYIGNNVQFKHNGLGCVLHPSTTIHDNCWIYQNVTIGGNTRYKYGKLDNTGAPIIGKGTVIYSGAVVVGPIYIGEGSVIGANTVVTKDVPPNSLVYGNPSNIKKIKEGIEFITPDNFKSI